MGAVVILVIHLNKGMQITTGQLTRMDNFTSAMVRPLEIKAIIYSLFTVGVLVIGICALLLDFVNSHARYHVFLSGQICEGSTPCFMVSDEFSCMCLWLHASLRWSLYYCPLWLDGFMLTPNRPRALLRTEFTINNVIGPTNHWIAWIWNNFYVWLF